MSNKRSRAFGGGGFSGVGDDFLRADDDELSQDEEIERDDGSESDSAENGETSCKRTKRELVDRLSSLPEPLLIHILSRLGMKRAVATSVLSKRWKNLWTEMPDLKFKEISTKSENICGLAIRIHRAIAHRTYKSLNALEIRFAYDECFLYNINLWIGFAIKSKVKILSLGLHPSLDSPYELPQEIYSCSSLTRLSLQGCIAEPRGSIHWKNLTDLLIEDMELSEDVIQKVLSGCPVLHALDLRSCWGFECLHIDSKSLDNLSIQECEEEEEAQGTLLEISAPYLRSLHLEHFPIYTKELRIKNIQSLVRAQIHFSDSGSSLEVMYNVMELFRTMHHVKELELGCMWVKILSDMAATGLQFPESRRDSLVLEAWREHSISGILALLESSPYLETLVLHCYDEYEEDSTKFITPLAKDDINCEMTRLKTVHLHDYADPYWAGEPMLTMARVLLKRATVLEKMVVDAGGSLTEHSSLNTVKIGEALFSYPKSSQKAVVTFDP